MTGDIKSKAEISFGIPMTASLNAQLNSVGILGDVQAGVTRSSVSVKYDTTEHWNEQSGYVPKRADIIVYSDGDKIERDGEILDVPRIKIGDGMAYLIDLPFVDQGFSERLLSHIENTQVHITQEEREFWNNKLNFNIDGENLTLNRL